MIRPLFPALVTLLLIASGTTLYAAEVELEGEFIEGGMVIGHTQPGNSVHLDDLSLEIAEDGSFVFGFHRDAPDQQILEIGLSDGSVYHLTLKIDNREYAIQRIDNLDQARVTPPPEVVQRILNESAKVRSVRRHMLLATHFRGSWIWPLQGKVTGVYGSQRILNGEPRSPHYGIDVAAPEGTPVVAPADGVVVLVEDMYLSGVTLMVDHGMGIMSTMLHLLQSEVSVGDTVRQGEIIALSGSSGRSTGPHLDWRINWRNHARLDAGLLVPPMPDKLEQ